MGLWRRVFLGVSALLAVLLLIAVAIKKGPFSEVTAAWVQAVFAVVAIVASALFFAAERRVDLDREADRARDIAHTAGDMAVHATDLVAARLEAALSTIDGKVLFALRGHQTTEMVQAMRELDLGQLDPTLVKHFAYIRAGIYATNARITDVYDTERKRPALKPKRRERLKSAGRVLHMTRGHLANYQAALGPGASFSAATIPIGLEPFLEEAAAEFTSHPDAID